MIGVELATPELAHAIADLCFRRGLLVLECGSKTIRFSPPLIIDDAQARTIAELFAAVCKEASARHERVERSRALPGGVHRGRVGNPPRVPE